ncbi:DUF943 family protein [Serratia sp. UGAL515B_01]|uniref:DUF943 family protein n=1 Tax=Serratia sp. UGAL515B_01 TaxID=2986763 RepID=UPI002953134D|nr:DUF943 family protein [Serratia sp. UGAL515B_01]WON77168.1 DUF943 family protein [Serratia sp. UGAL515B_01]
MISKNKKNPLYTITGCYCYLYLFFWLSQHPVKIVDVHKKNEFSAVLVENFPLTDKGKIRWWLENKNILKEKYNIPNPAQDGFYSVIFWDFGDGYKEDKYDRRCFDDMKTNKNCIEKNSLIIIKNNKHNITFFTLDNGIYQLKNDDIVKK